MLVALLPLLPLVTGEIAAEITRGELLQGTFSVCADADQALKLVGNMRDELEGSTAKARQPEQKPPPTPVTTCEWKLVDGLIFRTLYSRDVRLPNGKFMRLAIVQVWTRVAISKGEMTLINVVLRELITDSEL